MENGKCVWRRGGRRVSYANIVAMKKYTPAYLAQLKKNAKRSKRSKSPAKRRRRKSRSGSRKARRRSSKSKRRSSKSRRRRSSKSRKSRKISGYARFSHALHLCATKKGLRCPPASALAKKWHSMPLKWKEKFNKATTNKEACRLYGIMARENKSLKITCRKRSKSRKARKSSKSRRRRSASKKRKTTKRKRSVSKRKTRRSASKRKATKRKTRRSTSKRRKTVKRR